MVRPGSLQSGNVVRFGPFETNLVDGQTRKYGLRIRLGGQPSRVLSLLLERAGKVVTRDELRRHLWADNTFVEFENGLNNAVKKLRSALGDSADKPLYIETVPRVGYRFVAPIGSAAALPAAMVENSNGAHAHFPSASSRGWFTRLALGTLVVALGVVAYGFLSPVPLPRVTAFGQGTLSNHLDGFGRIVTDGVRVYFLERTGDHDNLVQTSVSGGPSHIVDAPFLNTRIFDISRDKSEFLIGNFVVRQPGLPLWIWPVQGGSPIRVGNALVDDASWAPDGQQILYARGRDVRTVRRDGTGDRVLIHTPGYPYWIRFSPDGQRLIYTVASLQSDSESLWQASLDGSDAHMRFRGWSDPPRECCAEWTPDGKYLVFSSSHRGLWNIWAIREKRFLLHWRAPAPVQLTPTPRAMGPSVLDPNGTRLFTPVTNEATEFVRYDVHSRQSVPIPGVQNVAAFWPSKDRKWIVLQDFEWTLWRARRDGSARLQLTSAPLIAAQPRWSPDGREIAFEAHRFGQPTRAYVVSTEGGLAEELLPAQGEQAVPDWSPDGKTLAVAMNVDQPADASAPRGIYLVDRKTHHSVKIPRSEGLTSPMWSPDGKYFTAKAADEKTLFLFDPQAQTWTPIASGSALSSVSWSPDSKHVFLQRTLEKDEPIYRLTPPDFKPERVVGFRSFLQAGAETCVLESVAPDGSLIIRIKRSGAHMYAFDLEFP